ncbi:MAG: hypothetical protein BWZ02_01613 [Lentisphaerae bacterium ADurb.BinA184]|nr:MAG: hypothetical protein BWZ02_01613 [Lentisphaerae bacterium ADurb.BinA184]
MNRTVTRLAALATVALSLAAAAAPVYFTDPTRVNLLDRWTQSGAYAYSVQHDTESQDPMRALVIWQDAWRFWVGNDYPTAHNIWLQVNFPAGAPGVGRVQYAYLNADHGTDTIAISDQNGTYITESSPGVTTGVGTSGRTHLTGVNTTVAARTGNQYLRYQTTVTKETLTGDPPAYNGTTWHNHAIQYLRAFAAAGENVQMDETGTDTYFSGYSVFYDSNVSNYAITNATHHPSVTASMLSNWLDGNLATMEKQPYGVGEQHTEWIIIPFTQKHNFVGARPVLYDDTRSWDQLMIEVAMTDAGPWTQVFYTDAWRTTTSNMGWADFGTGDGSVESAIGKYVRLSWLTKPGGAYTEVEMRDFQLFTLSIPEPGTFALLAGAGMLVLRRRRG